MAVNYWAVLTCGLVSMVVGSIWYGPIFGKLWMRLNGVTQAECEKNMKSGKGYGHLYATQLLLSLFQAFVLGYFIPTWPAGAAVTGVLGLWLTFVMPTTAGATMWTNDSTKDAWARFFVQSGCQLINFVAFALILSNWR